MDELPVKLFEIESPYEESFQIAKISNDIESSDDGSMQKRKKNNDIESSDDGSMQKRKKNNDIESSEDGSVQRKKPRKTRTPNKKTPEEFKKMIIEAIESGTCTRKSAASTFNLPYHTIVSIYKQFLDTGDVEGKKKSELKHKKLQDIHIQFLLDSLAENCNLNIKELVVMLKNKFSIDICYALVAKKIPAFHYSLKRLNETLAPAVTPEIIDENKEYCEIFLKLKESGRLLVYFDQTEFQVSMRRFPGRAPKGEENQLTPPPSVRSRHKTVMASITQNALIYYRTIDEPLKRTTLLEYLKGLIRELTSRRINGAVLVMSNAAFNHCQAVKEVTQSVGYEVIFMPAHNIYFNPVERVFTRWVTIIRSRKPRNEKELEDLVDSFRGTISGEQCHYFCKSITENAINCLNGTLKYCD